MCTRQRSGARSRYGVIIRIIPIPTIRTREHPFTPLAIKARYLYRRATILGVKYPQVTEWSLIGYREALVARRASVSAEGQEAIRQLLATIDAALDHSGALKPDEIQFGVSSLANVPPRDFPAYINQYTLGVGWDGAPIVVMGTEPAEKPDSAEDMAWHAIYSILVAADSRPDVLDRIVSGSSWQAAAKGGWSSAGKRPYHLQPNDFIHAEGLGGSPTWKVVAQVVASKSPDGWRDLLETRLEERGLGDDVYQLDRSALPAMTSAKGSPPTDVRVAFLVEVLRLLRQNARVLLLHGFGAPRLWQEWWVQDQKVIAAFLNIDAGNLKLAWRKVAGRDSLGTLSHNGRKVIYSRALSNLRYPCLR